MEKPYAYWIESGIAWVVMYGDADLDRMADVQIRLAADPAFRVDMPRLIDARQVTSWMPPKDFVKIRDLAAKLHAGLKTRRKIALVSGDTMVEKIAKIYQDLIEMGPQAGLVEYRYIPTVEAALAWLKNDPSG